MPRRRCACVSAATGCGQQRERDRVAHCAVAAGVGVQVVAAVVRRPQPAGPGRVADGTVEVDDGVGHGLLRIQRLTARLIAAAAGLPYVGAP